MRRAASRHRGHDGSEALLTKNQAGAVAACSFKRS